MFLQVKSRTFYSKVKSLDFNLLVKSTKVTRHSLFSSHLGCRCTVSPASVLLPNAMIKWFFGVSSWVFFCCFHDFDVFFYLLIFELTGPNLMKNRPCQNHSTLPGLLLFSSFIYFNTFLKFLSLTKESIARKLNLSFLNNYQDLMTEKLSNSSLDFKKHSLPLYLSCQLIFLPYLSLFESKKSKRDQVKFDHQKWTFFLVKS